MHTKSTVRDIFHSGSYQHAYDEQILVDIAFLLNHGLLKIRQEDIELVDTYYGYIEKIKSGEIARIDVEGGSDGHLALKLVGKDYLSREGFKEIPFEQEFLGYIPDVMTKHGEILLECGNTNPDKVFKYFKNKGVARMIILPYPSEFDIHITAYIFMPTEQLSDFLIFREKELGRIAFSKKSQ